MVYLISTLRGEKTLKKELISAHSEEIFWAKENDKLGMLDYRKPQLL